MIDFNNAVATIRDNNGFESNDYDDSFYRVYNTPRGVIQVRISNHGTHLWTWVKNAPVNPSKCYANICIVLSENGKHNSSVEVAPNKYHNNENNPGGKPYSFEVLQYVYNCTILSMRNASIINKRIMEIPNSGCFVDPLKTDRDKHAGVYRLIPNKPIETVVSQSFVGVGPQQMIPQNTTGANARPATRKTYGMDNSIEESITMKNTIKLNESQFHTLVRESVKKVLKEIAGTDEISSDLISRASQKFHQKYGGTLFPGPDAKDFPRDKHGNLLYPKDMKPLADHYRNFSKAYNDAKFDEDMRNPLVRKACELYKDVDLEQEVSDWTDDYGCDVNLWGEIEDENGGIWKFEGWGAGVNVGGGDIEIDHIEEMNFESPDGQTGSIPRP